MKIIKVSNIIPSGHLFANEISEDDLEELKALVDLTPSKGKYRVWWNGKSFIQEELQRFLWYYENRSELKDQMAVEYLIIPEGSPQSIN